MRILYAGIHLHRDSPCRASIHTRIPYKNDKKNIDFLSGRLLDTGSLWEESIM